MSTACFEGHCVGGRHSTSQHMASQLPGPVCLEFRVGPRVREEAAHACSCCCRLLQRPHGCCPAPHPKLCAEHVCCSGQQWPCIVKLTSCKPAQQQQQQPMPLQPCRGMRMTANGRPQTWARARPAPATPAPHLMVPSLSSLWPVRGCVGPKAFCVMSSASLACLAAASCWWPNSSSRAAWLCSSLSSGLQHRKQETAAAARSAGAGAGAVRVGPGACSRMLKPAAQRLSCNEALPAAGAGVLRVPVFVCLGRPSMAQAALLRLLLLLSVCDVHVMESTTRANRVCRFWWVSAPHLPG